MMADLKIEGRVENNARVPRPHRQWAPNQKMQHVREGANERTRNNALACAINISVKFRGFKAGLKLGGGADGLDFTVEIHHDRAILNNVNLYQTEVT